jgi:signal peptidase I
MNLNKIIVITCSIITVVLIISYPMNIFSNNTFNISSKSMMPTIKPVDKIEIDTEYYKNNIIQRGDIILYYGPMKELFLHRCIAISGDKFEIKNDKVYINNKEYIENYVIGKTKYENKQMHPLIEGVVPDNFIIALGDNRENSFDCRYSGFVPLKNIIGKYIVK